MVTIREHSPGQAALHDDDLDRLFGALADPTRRAILARLATGIATVRELADPFPMSRPAISKHLNVLEEAGLVQRLPDGRMTQCRLEPSGMEAAHEWLHRYRQYWETSLDRLAEYLENESTTTYDQEMEG